MSESKTPGTALKTLLFLTAPWTALLILVTQNLLGMYLNLWLDFTRFSTVSKVFASVPLIDVHVAVGVLILSMTFGRFVLGMQKSYRVVRTPSILLFLFALLAFGSGLEFTFFGQNDVFSFTMELGFGGLIASAAYVLLISNRFKKWYP